MFYAVDAAGLGNTIGWLLNDCCMEHPEVVACCRHGKPISQAVVHPHRPALPATGTGS
ncbi:MAG: hypothetical protein R3D63_13665 [Paracoccaceae bacterium]